MNTAPWSWPPPLESRLVADWVAKEIAANAAKEMDLTIYALLAAHRLTWEQQLAEAIERRSVRSRLRRLPRRVWSSEAVYRVRMAVNCLRGHYPEPDW